MPKPPPPRIRAFCDRLPEAAEVTPHVEVLSGSPVAEIVTLARDERPDLIVLGLHRDRGLWDTIRETTMERIVRISPRPVLLVTDAVDHDYTRALAAVDTSKACTAALLAAARLVDLKTIDSFYAYHVPFRGLLPGSDRTAFAKPYLAEAARDLDLWLKATPTLADLPRPRIVNAIVAEAVAQAIARHTPQLFIAGAHGSASSARFRLGSLTADLVRDPPCDLLVARTLTAD
ncbi:MAG: universal stress protein [Pseudomonadota bacterium]